MDNLSGNSYELPTPKGGVELYSPDSNSGSINPEKELATKEIKVVDNTIPNQQPIVSVSVVSPVSTITTQTSSDDDLNNTGIAAEDLDVIEKEWIVKAKKVVTDTRNDPRQQNIELAKVKAEYIKKRFNKSLKIEDSKQ